MLKQHCFNLRIVDPPRANIAFVLVVGMLVASVHDNVFCQTTIPELLKTRAASTAPYVLLLHPPFREMDLQSLAREADLVVEGIVDRSSAALAADRKAIETTVDIAVLRVLSQNISTVPVPAPAIRRLQVTQPGGEAEVDGHAVAVVVLGAVQLEVGGRFILFLKPQTAANDGRFTILNGAYGVFAVRDSLVFSFAPTTATIHLHDGLTIDSLDALIDSSLASQGQN